MSDPYSKDKLERVYENLLFGMDDRTGWVECDDFFDVLDKTIQKMTDNVFYINFIRPDINDWVWNENNECYEGGEHKWLASLVNGSTGEELPLILIEGDCSIRICSDPVNKSSFRTVNVTGEVTYQSLEYLFSNRYPSNLIKEMRKFMGVDDDTDLSTNK